MRYILTTLTCLIASVACAQPFLIDGKFDDWLASTSVADPAGDSTGELDAVELGAVLNGTTVTISLTITEPLNLQSGKEPNPDLSLVVDGGNGAVEVRFRGRMAQRRDTGAALTWDTIRYSSAPTVASTRFEIRVDLAAIGGVADETVTLTLEGADTLATPLVVSEKAPAGLPRVAQAPPFEKRSVRFASLNTFRTGLFQPAQAAQLARLLVAAQADIYLLQEEYNSSQVQIENLFNAIMPLGKGSAWRAYKHGDTAIVARWALVALPNHDPSYSAAAVIAPDGPIVVVSQHPKCCGYAGNSDDDRRVVQAALTAQVIDEVRAGKFDKTHLLSSAPVVIGGDWNLVGSHRPLDRLTAPQLPGIAELTIPNRHRADVSTWRELDGLGFPPGRLDLIVYDDQQLRAVHAEVFDSEGIGPERREMLGVQAEDSRASDHLMLIADFQRNPGD